MIKGVCFLLFVIMILPFAIAASEKPVTGKAVTGEVITGNVPQNVSIFVGPSIPVFTVFSPLNTSYNSSDILLNYSITNGADSVWYSLDDGTNISLVNDSENSLVIASSYTGHILNLYANNSLGFSFITIDFTLSEAVYCGDGDCNNGEDCNSCPGDCTCPPDPDPDPDDGDDGDDEDVDTPSTPSIPSVRFSVDPVLIEVELKEGESKTEYLEVRNTGSSTIQVYLEFEDPTENILPEQTSYSIPSGESVGIPIIFDATSIEVDIIYSKLILRSGSREEEVNLVMSVEKTSALFDVSTEIVLAEKTTSPGLQIPILIGITNLAYDGNPIDAELIIKITDFDETEVSELSREQLEIWDKLTLERQITLPESLSGGTYLIITDLSYNDINATAYDTIEIIEESKPYSSYGEYLYYGIIAFILLALILFIIIFWRRRKNKENKIQDKTNPKIAPLSMTNKSKKPVKPKILKQPIKQKSQKTPQPKPKQEIKAVRSKTVRDVVNQKIQKQQKVQMKKPVKKKN